MELGLTTWECEGTNLTREAKADAQGNTARDEHGQVLGSAVECGPEKEKDAPDENGRLAAVCPGHARGREQRGQQSGQIQ